MSENILNIDAKKLRFVSMIHHTKIATASSPFSGILLEEERIVATDGYHLAFADNPYPFGFGVEHRVRIEGLPYNLPNVLQGEQAELTRTSETEGIIKWPTGKLFPVKLSKVEAGTYPDYERVIPDWGTPVFLHTMPINMLDTVKVVERMNDPKGSKESNLHDGAPIGGTFGHKGKPTWVPHFMVAHGGMTYTRALLLNSEVKELKRRANDVQVQL